MIITCNCGEKKFTLPDNSIPVSGRMVQCGYCGLKWKQFPVDEFKKIQSVSSPKKIVSKPQSVEQKTQKPQKAKKKATKKSREISLYSPEYLAKKHGIKIQDTKTQKIANSKNVKQVPFGFYNSLLLFIVIVIFISRTLYFSQDFIVEKIPLSEFYLSYFFENIRNIFEIFKDLVTGY